MENVEKIEIKLLKSLIKKFNSDIDETNIEKIQQILKDFDNCIIPDSYSFIKENLSIMVVRDIFIEKQGFPLLSHNWIDKLADWIGDRKCLEVMSGCGSLSKVLQDKGISINATDNFSWKHRGNWNAVNNYWTNIEDIDCINAVKKYGQDVDLVIMSWPPYNEDQAYNVLKNLREVNKDAMIIYIGEGSGGCTGDNAFHEELKYVNDEAFEEINKYYNTWFGLHDSLWLIK